MIEIRKYPAEIIITGEDVETLKRLCWLAEYLLPEYIGRRSRNMRNFIIVIKGVLK